jgi:TPR repeat protein
MPQKSPRIVRRRAAWRALRLALAMSSVLSLRAQDDLKALQAKAEAGDPAALTSLGTAYAAGQGVPQDYSRAMQYFRRAADAKYAPALYNLGLIFESGRGAPRDPAAAFRSYLAAAEEGLPQAQFNVGNLYAAGQGVAPDPFEAALWFRLAARQGLAEAQYNLALAYEAGRGVPKNEEQAQTYFRAAAMQGHVRASYNLALMLEGGLGSAPDLGAAAELYRAAALKGFGPAQNNYGIMLAKGRGVAPNLPEAYAWLSLAVENGISPENRDLVARKLTADETAAAKAALGGLRSQFGLSAGATEITFAADAAPRPSDTPEGNLQANLTGARRNLSTDSASAGKVDEQLLDAGTKIAELKGRNDELQARVAGLEAQLEQAGQKGNDELSRERSEHERDKADLMAQLDALRAKLADSDKVLKKSEQDLAAQAELGQRLAQLEEAAKKGNEELALSHEETSRDEAELAALKDKLARDESELARERSEHEGDKSVLAAQLESLRSKLAESEKAAMLARIHVVQDGDSLARISLEYYGTENRWQDIYDANRDVLDAAHSLKVGQLLKVP